VSGGERQQGALGQLGQKEQSAGTTLTTPFLRLSLVLLAAGQYWRRAAALPPRSVPNQPSSSPVEAAGLRRALKQQLTPSCCAQLLQRVVPWYWQASTRHALQSPYQELFNCDRDDMCSGQIVDSLMMVGRMFQTCASPVDAVGELRGYWSCQQVNCQRGALCCQTVVRWQVQGQGTARSPSWVHQGAGAKRSTVHRSQCPVCVIQHQGHVCSSA
jgi:hypothetical protein